MVSKEFFLFSVSFLFLVIFYFLELPVPNIGVTTTECTGGVKKLSQIKPIFSPLAPIWEQAQYLSRKPIKN